MSRSIGIEIVHESAMSKLCNKHSVNGADSQIKMIEISGFKKELAIDTMVGDMSKMWNALSRGWTASRLYYKCLFESISYELHEKPYFVGLMKGDIF